MVEKSASEWTYPWSSIIIGPQILFIIKQSVVDDFRQILGHLYFRQWIIRPIETFMFLGSIWRLGDNQQLANLSIAQFVIIRIISIPRRDKVSSLRLRLKESQKLLLTDLMRSYCVCRMEDPSLHQNWSPIPPYWTCPLDFQERAWSLWKDWPWHLSKECGWF